MSKSIFISHVHEDSDWIKNIKKWADNDQLGNVVITYETKDKRDEGEAAIKNYLKPKIQGAAIVLVLIGKDTHNHGWIATEVELANSFHKQIICVRVPKTTGAVPKLLATKKIIAFDPKAIKKELMR